MNNTVINYNKITAQQLKFTNTKTTPNMDIIFIEKLYIQTPKIQLNYYGIPNNTFLKTDLERSFIKIPLDMETNTPFINKLNSIDQLLLSTEFKKQYLGEQHNKYTYTPIIKLSTHDINPNYCKFKLDITTNDKTITNINTKLFINKELKTFNTIDELSKLIKYKSTIKIIIQPIKLWILKSNKTYGLTFKIKQIQTENIPEQNIEFIDSDTE
jgi:hypothetical protein